MLEKPRDRASRWNSRSSRSGLKTTPRYFVRNETRIANGRKRRETRAGREPPPPLGRGLKCVTSLPLSHSKTRRLSRQWYERTKANAQRRASSRSAPTFQRTVPRFVSDSHLRYVSRNDYLDDRWFKRRLARVLRLSRTLSIRPKPDTSLQPTLKTPNVQVAKSILWLDGAPRVSDRRASDARDAAWPPLKLRGFQE